MAKHLNYQSRQQGGIGIRAYLEVVLSRVVLSRVVFLSCLLTGSSCIDTLFIYIYTHVCLVCFMVHVR